jgi:DNA anti-recombination protein RmuC
MTMIKAEYTGRVQRRERKIESLKDALTEAGLPIPEDVEDNKAPATRASSKSARAEAPVDKENIRSNNVQRMR